MKLRNRHIGIIMEEATEMVLAVIMLSILAVTTLESYIFISNALSNRFYYKLNVKVQGFGGSNIYYLPNDWVKGNLSKVTNLGIDRNCTLLINNYTGHLINGTCGIVR